jgi:AhpD family alkylhydroperoxidase
MGQLLPEAAMRGALRRAINQIRFLEPVPPRRADPLTAAVYRQLESDFGMLAPPVALHAPVPQLLAACWLMLRESLVADAVIARETLEAVAAAVSAGNACPYCVTVHGATEQALANAATASTQPNSAAADWARLVGLRDTAGRPPVDGLAAARLIGVVMTFHYLNRMVNVFLDPSPLPGALPNPLKRSAVQLLGRFAGATAGRRHLPGESVQLLPADPRGRRPAWAYSDPLLGEAFARAGAAIDRVADQVPATVRLLVAELLGDWDGRPPGLDTRWLAEPVAGLPAEDRPAGRLALLTAFASDRVTARHVNEFRHTSPGDPALLSLVSWTSLAAARQLTSWIPADWDRAPGHRGNA